MKKLLLSLGVVGTAVAPLAAAVSCGDGNGYSTLPEAKITAIKALAAFKGTDLLVDGITGDEISTITYAEGTKENDPLNGETTNDTLNIVLKTNANVLTFYNTLHAGSIAEEDLTNKEVSLIRKTASDNAVKYYLGITTTTGPQHELLAPSLTAKLAPIFTTALAK